MGGAHARLARHRSRREPGRAGCAGCSSTASRTTAPSRRSSTREIEWSSKDEEWFEEGCLSLPRVHVDVERPIHVRVRAFDGDGRGDRRRGVRPRGSRDPARDGPPRRRADHRPRSARPAPRGDAHPARARRRGLGGPGCRADRLPRHLATSPRPSCGCSPQTDHRPQLVVTRPDRPAGRGRHLTPPPVAGARRRARHRARPARGRERRRRARADRRPRAPGADRLRVRRADPRAAAQRPRDPQRPPVAAAALARGCADRARDHGRRRARPASRSCD